MMNHIYGYVEKRSVTASPVTKIFLVCGTDSAGHPNAMLNAQLLESKLMPFSIVVEYDKPSISPNIPVFEIPTALQSTIALENYIAMILKKMKIPERTVEWDAIRSECHDDAKMAERLGRFNPFLCDHKKWKNFEMYWD